MIPAGLSGRTRQRAAEVMPLGSQFYEWCFETDQGMRATRRTLEGTQISLGLACQATSSDHVVRWMSRRGADVIADT
jgi:hypothetical protein